MLLLKAFYKDENQYAGTCSVVDSRNDLHSGYHAQCCTGAAPHCPTGSRGRSIRMNWIKTINFLITRSPLSIDYKWPIYISAKLKLKSNLTISKLEIILKRLLDFLYTFGQAYPVMFGFHNNKCFTSNHISNCKNCLGGKSV